MFSVQFFATIMRTLIRETLLKQWSRRFHSIPLALRPSVSLPALGRHAWLLYDGSTVLKKRGRFRHCDYHAAALHAHWLRRGGGAWWGGVSRVGAVKDEARGRGPRGVPLSFAECELS